MRPLTWLLLLAGLTLTGCSQGYYETPRPYDYYRYPYYHQRGEETPLSPPYWWYDTDPSFKYRQ